MIPTPNRRWFRFSLRTLFVLVTVLCVWLGWYANLVGQRQSLLPEIEAENEAWTRVKEKAFHAGKDLLVGRLIRFGPAPPAKIPFVRTLLGDKACRLIERHTEADARKMIGFFPEATVIYYEPLIVRVGPVPAWIDDEFQEK